jgi:hypothetical protein
LNEGRVYVFHGRATGLAASPAWIVEGDQVTPVFGGTLGTAGDVNGDGFSDVVIGAPYYDNGQVNEGRAFVYHGSATGLAASSAWTAESNQDEALFGYAGTAGDVNGDGFSDVIVAAVYYDNDQHNEGRAYVYHGSATGLIASPAWMAEGDQDGAGFGSAVGTAGDVNGDGYADVVVGAYYYDSGQWDEGRAFVYHGSATGLAASSAWTAESDQDSTSFGISVATTGDVNGDGFGDVIIGAGAYDNGQQDEGRAYVYHGNQGGLSLRPQQRRADNTAPIAHLGKSDQPDRFRLALLGRTPSGRGWVTLEWEVKPRGVLFDGTGLQRSATWLDSGTAGAQLNELVSGLNANTLYHWRVRLRYHPATTPFQSYSRWLTNPWNGWNEARLRTAPGVIPPTPTPTPAPEFAWHQEAEDGYLTPPMAIGEAQTASACRFVHDTTSWSSGAVAFAVYVPYADEYYLWARAMGLAWTQNSFSVSVDGSPGAGFEIHPLNNQWTWNWQRVPVTTQGGTVLNLATGAHTIQFQRREANARLDLVMLTNVAGDILPVITPCEPTPAPTATPTNTSTNTPTPMPTATPTPTATPVAVPWSIYLPCIRQ